MDNCVQATTAIALYYFYQHQNLQDATIQLSRNSWLARRSAISIYFQTGPTAAEKASKTKPSQLKIGDSILDSDAVLVFNQGQTPSLPPEEAEVLFAGLLDCQGRGNLYGEHLLQWNVAGKLLPPGFKSLAQWKNYWKSSETDSLQGRALFKGGDLLARLATAPEKITPEDFRLRPDSVGAKDDKFLGADVDLVGPGPAYAR